MIKCSIHPRYTGKYRPPKALCLDCWKIWLEQNPNKIITANDASKFLRAIEVHIGDRFGTHTHYYHEWAF